MQKEDTLIYIVEDDKDFAEVLQNSLSSQGYHVKTFQDAHTCIQQHKLNPPDLMIVDCMLPQMAGLEMVKKIHEEDAKTPVIFMSGIFTDKNFIKNAITSTEAIGFFTKPFEVEKLTEKIEENFSEPGVEEDSSIDILYQKPSLSLSELEGILQQTQSLHSFHLLKAIYELCKTQWTGKLNLKDGDDQHSLHMHKGNIVDVKIKDPNSYFGRLLVANNYLDPEELDTVLATQSKKRIGEKLVDANLISPHTIDLINAEQMCLRMGLLFHDVTYDLEIIKDNIEESSSYIDQKLLDEYCIEWILTKFDSKWLQTFYMSLHDNPFIIKNPSLNIYKELKNHPSSYRMEGFFASLQPSRTIDDTIENAKEKTDTAYLLLHCLVVCSYIYFDRSSTAKGQSQKLDRVKKILDNTENQDYFQILGIGKKAKIPQIKKAYHDLAKIFHPDTIPTSASKEYTETVKKLFAKITLAYETLSDPTKKEKYLKELETGQATVRLKVENLFEEIKEILQSRRYSQALKKFDELIDLFPPTSEIKLYWLWARIQNIKNHKNATQELTEISEELNKIPPEDRHSSIYYFVKGIFQKTLGERDLAIGNLKHALSIEPGFVEAKRELNVLQLSEKNKPIDILNADLKDVVGHIFKKVTK